ncbi:pimeloyl-ACP methyl ester carboxylesterase [Micromonospora pisi]|uniref:Pimeloyl-ACP methyl ester carboxylesterase n=1 Tax=Micromonospora pisi TaxID=589240 RepID=A0A495JVH6_9ACTN|nr:alpha/beta fold hydrolase [Micromonospora pisi]RKR92312.1 pimeloyl-ACP methyl ester carboxylesterase [Micromonospora pisi]
MGDVRLIQDGVDADGGAPTLLLVHGLGATGAVWDRWRPYLDEHWAGRWLAPDLPGHGAAKPLPRYTFGAMAASLADLVDRDRPVVVLGHSLGGVLGLVLASGWFGVRVRTAIGFGIKVHWTADELAKAGALARRPVTWFDSREASAERYLRVSGLAGLLPPDDPAVSTGIVAQDGRWRLAMEPATFGVGEPDLPGLLAAARGRVLLARGEHDPMVTTDQLTHLSPSAVTLPGLGHNAHVENPSVVSELLTRALPLARATGPAGRS